MEIDSFIKPEKLFTGGFVFPSIRRRTILLPDENLIKRILKLLICKDKKPRRRVVKIAGMRRKIRKRKNGRRIKRRESFKNHL